jgi:hypothetical protein
MWSFCHLVQLDKSGILDKSILTLFFYLGFFGWLFWQVLLIGVFSRLFLIMKRNNNHYNNRGLFCNPNIITNNKERCFRNPAVANHNSSQILKLLRYHNIRTRTIASPLQLPNLIQLPNFSDYNCFYPLFAINITSETICSKPITATT